MVKVTTDISNVKIWEDLLDDRFLLDLDEESNIYPWKLNNVANRYSFPYGSKGTHLLWGAVFDHTKKEEVPKNLRELYNFLNKNFLKNEYNLTAIQLNAQSQGQEGTSHIDGAYGDNKYTLMVFINYKWEKEWGGEFQFVDAIGNTDFNILKSIDYKPGKVILFNGNIPHRGLSPNIPYVVRKSLVYRLEKNS